MIYLVKYQIDSIGYVWCGVEFWLGVVGRKGLLQGLFLQEEKG
jgi:hypothetical protein